MMRSHYCGQLNESLDGQEVTLCGWVHRRRDHGGVIFLDIRDREGMAQVVFDPDRAETFAAADRVRSEYVVQITGKVRKRPEGAVNANMASGAIEILGYQLNVLNEAETPPFPLNEYSDVGEETRLRYRFIDLRRPEMADKLRLRSRITSSIRRFLDENGFLDVESPIVKNIPQANLNTILDRVGAVDGDIVFFGADKFKVVSEALGALRIRLGHDFELLTCEWAPMWVVDFPMFEENEDGSFTALHHPFTAPKCTPEELEANPATALSRAYDMVLNGTELGGGSIRIHRKEMQQAVFRLLGIEAAEQEEKFGFLLDALKFGAPPHGGLAFGLDRLVMLMTGAQSIREVIAFPKTQSAACVMTQAPGMVDAKALRELHIRLREQTKVE